MLRLVEPYDEFFCESRRRGQTAHQHVEDAPLPVRPRASQLAQRRRRGAALLHRGHVPMRRVHLSVDLRRLPLLRPVLRQVLGLDLVDLPVLLHELPVL